MSQHMLVHSSVAEVLQEVIENDPSIRHDERQQKRDSLLMTRLVY